MSQNNQALFSNSYVNGTITPLHYLLAQLLELDARNRLFLYLSGLPEIKIPPPEIAWLINNTSIFTINFDVLQHLSLDQQTLFFSSLYRCNKCRRRPCQCFKDDYGSNQVTVNIQGDLPSMYLNLP